VTNYIVRVNDTRPNVRVDPTNNIVRVIQPTYSLTISSPVVGNFAAVSHTHVLANITDAGTAAAADTGDFAAASHTHVLADITDAGTAAAADTGDFAADDHTHSFTDLTDVEWGRFNFPTPLNGNVVQYLNGKWSNNSLNQSQHPDISRDRRQQQRRHGLPEPSNRDTDTRADLLVERRLRAVGQLVVRLRLHDDDRHASKRSTSGD
jgi:hypothetical protein